MCNEVHTSPSKPGLDHSMADVPAAATSLSNQNEIEYDRRHRLRVNDFKTPAQYLCWSV